MNTKQLTTIDYLNLIKLKKGMEVYLTKEEKSYYEGLLLRRPNLDLVIALNDVMNFPYAKTINDTFDLVNELSKRVSITNMVLDKLMKKLDIPEEEINEFWDSALKEFDKANQEELEKLKQKESKVDDKTNDNHTPSKEVQTKETSKAK